MLQDIFLISLTVSVVIGLFLPLRKLLRRRYAAARLYLVWLLLALRLIIPFRWEWENAPVQVPAEEVTEFVGDLTISDTPAQAVPTPTPVQKQFRFTDTLPYLWAAGTIGMLAYHLGAYFLFRRKVQPYLIPLEQEKREGLFVKDPPVYRCAAVQGPMMLGYFRPMILLPETEYTPEELIAVLLHERAHFRRKDMWYKLLLLLANAVHWFNPLVWWMVKKAEEDLEYACDELVIRRQGLEFKKQYSRAIVKTAEREA